MMAKSNFDLVVADRILSEVNDAAHYIDDHLQMSPTAYNVVALRTAAFKIGALVSRLLLALDEEIDLS